MDRFHTLESNGLLAVIGWSVVYSVYQSALRLVLASYRSGSLRTRSTYLLNTKRLATSLSLLQDTLKLCLFNLRVLVLCCHESFSPCLLPHRDLLSLSYTP